MQKEATLIDAVPKRELYFARPEVEWVFHMEANCAFPTLSLRASRVEEKVPNSEVVARNSNSMMQLRWNGQNTYHS